MKKKSPPYAIIGAAVLGILAIVLIFKHEKDQAQAQQDAIAAATKEKDDELAALRNGQQPVVPATQLNMRNVLYATQPIEPGVLISPSFYEKKLTPNEILPDAYTDSNDITGWYAVRGIEKGDPLTPRNVDKTLPLMSERLPAGMRLLALPIFNAEANLTGGFIVDGDRVDLLYTTPLSTQLVMQNLNVLFVPNTPKASQSETTQGVVPNPPPGAAISVAFAVTPEQAQALVYLSQAATGKFSMILRARKDQSEIKIKPYVASDYIDNYKKIQRTTDASILRVQQLAAAIELEEKKNQGQGNTNEISTPTPPSP